MGTTCSKASGCKRVTRKNQTPSPSPLTPKDHRRASSNYRINTPSTKNTRRALFFPKQQSFTKLYFDRSIPAWATIASAFAGSDSPARAIFFFAEKEDAKYTDATIVSRPVFRWFDSHWSMIMSFCESRLDSIPARKRFRQVDIYDEDYNRPATPSPRFSPDVTYTRNLALCIRADGLIEGFMLLTTDEDEDYDEGENALILDVLCTGPKGSGIGNSMMAALKGYAAEAEYSAITLESVASAVSFYKKQGFEVMKTNMFGRTAQMKLDIEEAESESDDE